MIVVAGPTASGKTALAISLAQALGGEIVSADSRQVYRCLDAGTAKPTVAERARVRHWLIDVADIDQPYDAATWARAARAAIDDIHSRHLLPIICGGTGLYLRALIDGLSPLPGRNEAIRERLSALAAKEGPESLHTRLKAVDPAAASAIPPGNLQRLMRALEVFELTGRPITEHWRAGRSGGLAPRLTLRLELSAQIQRERIETRARAMWPNLSCEAKALNSIGTFTGAEPGFSSLGYREALAYARGNCTEKTGFEALVSATVAYAKRQRTWFKSQLSARSLDASAPANVVLSRALAMWEEIHAEAAA